MAQRRKRRDMPQVSASAGACNTFGPVLVIRLKTTIQT